MTSDLKSKKIHDSIYIGIFGKTGAGKSSLINALLNEDDLLPVSSRKACTSCIVEVKAHEDLFNSTYKAEIQFISKEVLFIFISLYHLKTSTEWVKQLETLVENRESDNDQDTSDSDDDENGEDNEGELANEKLKAVYGEEGLSKSYKDLLNTKLGIPNTLKKSITAKSSKITESEWKKGEILTRNNIVKKNLKKKLERKAKRMLGTEMNSHEDFIEVFTVSSEQYRNDENPVLNKEETEIPGLEKHLMNLYVNQIQKDVENYVTVVSGITSFLNITQKNAKEEDIINKDALNEISELLIDKLKDLDTFFAECSSMLTSKLNDGVKKAATQCVQNAKNILKPVSNFLFHC
ncbi:SLIP GTPase, partial [Polypterus senegalus]